MSAGYLLAFAFDDVSLRGCQIVPSRYTSSKGDRQSDSLIEMRRRTKRNKEIERIE